MSYQAVESVMKYSQTTEVSRLLLMVIATHADKETYVASVGHDLLAREVNVSERTLRRYLHELEKSPELTVTRGNGKGNLTSYRINLPRWSKGDNMCPPLDQPKGDNMCPPSSLKKGTHVVRLTEPQRGTENGQRGTEMTPKGDKSTGAYKDIEPWNHVTREGERRESISPSPLEDFENLAKAVSTITGILSDPNTETEIRNAAKKLHGQGFTAAEVVDIQRQTGKIYKLRFCHTDLAEDRARLSPRANGAAAARNLVDIPKSPFPDAPFDEWPEELRARFR